MTSPFSVAGKTADLREQMEAKQKELAPKLEKVNVAEVSKSLAPFCTKPMGHIWSHF